MKKRLIALSCAAIIFSGCYGSYGLFNKVHKFTGSFGDKWINSVANLVAWIVPVYGICLFGDLLIFNTIEFWTGSNPVASGDTYFEKDAQGNSVSAIKNVDGSLSVSLSDAQGHQADLVLQRDADVIRALDQQGNVVAQYNVEK